MDNLIKAVFLQQHDPDPNFSSDGSPVDLTQRDVTADLNYVFVLNSKDLRPFTHKLFSQSSLRRRETGVNPDYFFNHYVASRQTNTNKNAQQSDEQKRQRTREATLQLKLGRPENPET